MEELFMKHPRKQGMTYVEHLGHSCTLSLIFFVGFVQAGIHAFLPFMFETGSSDVTRCLHKIINSKKEEVKEE